MKSGGAGAVCSTASRLVESWSFLAAAFPVLLFCLDDENRVRLLILLEAVTIAFEGDGKRNDERDIAVDVPMPSSSTAFSRRQCAVSASSTATPGNLAAAYIDEVVDSLVAFDMVVGQ